MRIAIKILIIFFLISDIAFPQAVTWQRVYGGPQPEYGRDGIQTFDGGFIIAALRQGQGGGILLLKLDVYGNEEWSRIIDTTSVGVCIRQTNDSGYVIAGSNNNFGTVIKTDKLGSIIWKKQYSINNEPSSFYKMKLLHNGELIMCGRISIPLKAYIVKTDSMGNVIWEKSYSNSPSFTIAYDISYANDGFIYLTGVTAINGFAKTLIGKIDESGNYIWFKSYGTEGKGDAQSGSGIIWEDNNKIFISGSKTIFFSYSGHFTKIDSTGNIVFQEDYNSADEFVSMVKFYNGYALCGSNGSTNKINLVTVDDEGNQMLNRFYSFNTIDEITYAYSISLTGKSGFFVTGLTTYQGSGINLNIIGIKTDSLGNVYVSIHSQNNIIPNEFTLYQNFPNPFNGQTKIKFDIKKDGFVNLSIYDISGKKISEILNGNYSEGTYEILLNLNFLPSGIYFYKMKNEEISEVKKMILNK